MSYPKLPRKRKKQYIKANSLSDYRIAQMMEEILMDERPNHKPRFVRAWKNYKPVEYW